MGSAVLATLAAALTAGIYGVVLARIATNAYGATGDFISFYAAGWLVRMGRGGELYDPAVMEWAQRLLYPGSFDQAIGYPLPVFAAWLFAPFSVLPFTPAFFLWMALNTALLAALLRALASELADVPRALRLCFVGCAAFALPTLAAIVFGQVDLIVLASLVAGHRLLRSGRARLAGGALALATVKPHLLAGVVLYLLVRREWRPLLSLTVAGAALLLIPALVTAPEALPANLRLLASYPSSNQNLAVNADVMSNWRGFVVSLTGRSDPLLWLPGLATLAAAALALALPRWTRAQTASEFDQGYSLAVLFPLIASPHLHTQSLVLLLLPAALGIRWWWTVSPTQERARTVVEGMLFVFSGLFFLPFLAIQGLSLTVFLLIGLYVWASLRWPGLTGRDGLRTLRAPVESVFLRREGIGSPRNP